MKTTTTTTTISTWGHRGAAQRLNLGTVVRHRADGVDTALDAIRRKILRQTGLVACGITPQGSSVAADGTIRARHYQITLGKSLSRRTGGGYSVEGALFVAIYV